MIPLTDCKNNYTYKLRSRNLKYGVFCAERGGFLGIREKFGGRYLFEEYHYDTGAPLGTVKPLLEIEECPIARDKEKELFEYLERVENREKTKETV